MFPPKTKRGLVAFAIVHTLICFLCKR